MKNAIVSDEFAKKHGITKPVANLKEPVTADLGFLLFGE